MRALAEFIMRGRLQASIVALVGNLIPLISPATVGLVSLRQGYQDALLVLMWAAMPILASLFMSSESVLIAMVPLVALSGVSVSAVVLRGTVSWQWTMLVAMLFSSLTLLVLGTLMTGEADKVIAAVETVMADFNAAAENPVSPFYILMGWVALSLSLEKVGLVFVIGIMAWLTLIHIIGSLLLARWWQSQLYNPGGFRQEFHNLRFSPQPAAVMVLLLILLYLAPAPYVPWASMLGIPLLLAGLGFLHHTVAAMGMGPAWLILIYLGLFFGPLSVVLVGIAFLDSFLNFRTRIAQWRNR